MVETKQVYVPMEEWDIAEARKQREAQWLGEGWRRAHMVSVPGKPMYDRVLALLAARPLSAGVRLQTVGGRMCPLSRGGTP